MRNLCHCKSLSGVVRINLILPYNIDWMQFHFFEMQSGLVCCAPFVCGIPLKIPFDFSWQVSIVSLLCCTIFKDIVCCLLSNICVATSFCRTLQTTSSFILFSICANCCILSWVTVRVSGNGAKMGATF